MVDGEELLKEMKREESRFEKVKKDVPRWHVFLYQFFHAIDQVISTYIPFAKKVWVTLFCWYRTIWAFFVYRRDENGVLIFSKPRAGTFLVGSFLFLFYGLLPTVYFVADTAIYFFTVKHNEVLYLHNSQEIEPEENIHAVQGNYTIPLNEDETIYLLVEDTWFNTLWSIVHKGNLFYPDYVAATVPPGLNKCHVTSYGLRLKSLMRRWEVYPYILSASCEPVTERTLKND